MKLSNSLFLCNAIRTFAGIFVVASVMLYYNPSLSLRSVLQLKLASAKDQADQSTGLRDTSVMILIPDGGAFESGTSPTALRAILREFNQPLNLTIYKYESNKQLKRLPSFYIDKYEVTNAQYNKFCQATGHRPSKYAKWSQFNGDLQPVVGISWNDADAYCRWAGKRLPTEDEWEKAARGTDRRLWPWGNERDKNRFNGKSMGRYSAAPVGSFPAGDSPYGVSDMAGNVWEMTASPWPNADNPEAKTMKGGSFLNTLPEVRTAVRWANGPDESRAEYLGFRCVKDVEK